MRIAILVAAVLAAVSFGASAQIYKWTDKDGKVHYGEKPPEDAKTSKEVKVNAGSGSEAPPTNWKEKEVEFQKRKQDREKAAANEQDQANAAERRRRLCENARGELEFVSSGVVYQNNEKGERVYFDEAARTRRMEEIKKKIAANC